MDECDYYGVMLDWNIGDVIGKRREKLRLTKDALAKRVGITPYQMGVIEKTGKCRTKTLELIAKALNTTPQQLYADIPIPQKPASSADFGITEFQKEMHRKLQAILESDYQSGILFNLEAHYKLASDPAARSKLIKYSPNEPMRAGDLVELPDGRIIVIGAVRGA